jgi:outer membrane protein TolC
VVPACPELIGHLADSLILSHRGRTFGSDANPSLRITRKHTADIREDEQILVAANAEVGVAKAQFFPQISLTGSGGGAAPSLA